eukprot:PLAT15169.2.p1 GENE.PLAT15169.2~~PLAT15169.2.p1  ORF type:complete len:164 (-),score=43.89 PLAT15169.2:130-621(-)
MAEAAACKPPFVPGSFELPDGITAEQVVADSDDITPFRRKVYTALLRVPPGYVTTYAHLARAIGCRSSQAVGQALKRNPFAPVVPCHRVISSTLRLGGFQGRTLTGGDALRWKKKLLEEEGLSFTDRSGVPVLSFAKQVWRFEDESDDTADASADGTKSVKEE